MEKRAEYKLHNLSKASKSQSVKKRLKNLSKHHRLCSIRPLAGVRRKRGDRGGGRGVPRNVKK